MVGEMGRQAPKSRVSSGIRAFLSTEKGGASVGLGSQSSHGSSVAFDNAVRSETGDSRAVLSAFESRGRGKRKFEGGRWR